MWQWCTEMMADEPYYATTGVTDMFFEKPWDMDFINNAC